MHYILKMIEEIDKETGLKQFSNPYSLGSYVKDMKNGKIVFEGDAIECRCFIIQEFENLKQSKKCNT